MERRRTLNIEALHNITKYCVYYKHSDNSYGNHFKRTVGKTIETSMKTIYQFLEDKGIEEYKKNDIKDVFESFFQDVTLSIFCDDFNKKKLRYAYKQIVDNSFNKRNSDHNNDFATHVYAASLSVLRDRDFNSLATLLTETYITEMRFNSKSYYNAKITEVFDREDFEKLAEILEDITCDVIYDICKTVDLEDFQDNYEYLTCNDFELSFFNSTIEFKVECDIKDNEFNSLFDFVCNNFHLTQEKHLKGDDYKYLYGLYGDTIEDIRDGVEKALKEINNICKNESDIINGLKLAEKSEFIKISIRDLKRKTDTTKDELFFDLAYNFLKKYVFTNFSNREYRDSLNRKMRNNTLRISNL